jgi:VWFA-related protein
MMGLVPMKRRVSLAGLFALLAGAVVGAGQAPQTPPAPAPPQTPTFKVQVDYVEVDLLVTDSQGRFVSDLTKDDFQLFEDGRPQMISTFTRVDIPIERAERPLFAAAPIEPDTTTNERAFDGRMYVLVLDALHTDFLRTVRVKTAARQFIERYLGANDLMAIVSTGGTTDGSQEFTQNRRLLLAAVDKFQGRKLDSPTLVRNDQYNATEGLGLSNAERTRDPYDAERGQHARTTMTHIKRISEWFGGVRGRRKTLLFLSEGIDYDIYNIFESSQASSIIDDTREAIAAATRNNVAIYAIDPRGLTGLGDTTIEVGGFADQQSTPTQTDPEAATPEGPPQNVGVRSLMSELRLSQDSLRWLGEETGGFASINRNEYNTAFERIVRDNSTYYVLAYYPANQRRDGKFHRIEVKTNRPGLTVRSRRGYVAPRGNPPAPKPTKGASNEVIEVLNSPLPVGGLTMRSFAAPFKGNEPNASVVVGVELLGRDLSLTPGNKVEISYIAVDSKGKTFGYRTDFLTINLRPESLDRVQQTGFRVMTRMQLPPGRYQVHIASRDPLADRSGSVIQDLDVPEFSKLPFSMSGLVLTSVSGASYMTAQTDEQLKELLPAPPIALRTFPQGDELAIYAEVYDDGRTPPHQVDILTTVRTDAGAVKYKNEEQRSSADLGGKRGGYEYSARIPLKGFDPGLYVLTVEATSRLANRPSAKREVVFNVGPAR